MKKSEITTRMQRLTEIGDKTTDSTVFNRCLNRLVVLEIMLKRFESDEVAHTGEWYDEETEFRSAYDNTVDELEEMLNELPEEKQFIKSFLNTDAMRLN